MRDYFLRRALLIVPTLLGATFLVHLLTYLAPGGPVEQMLAQRAAAGVESGRGALTAPITEEQINALKAYYGYDKGPIEGYFHWLGNILRGNLGDSTRYGVPVAELIANRLPVSAFYGLASFLLIYGVCIPLGILKAIQHRTWVDNATSVLIFAGYAIPGYAMGALLLVFFAGQLGWFPVRGFVSDEFDQLDLAGKAWDLLRHAVLPLTAYLVGAFAINTMLMKNNLLDNLAADYVRLAVAKGEPASRAILRHALRNSLIPVASTLGQNLTLFVGGSFLIERVFTINGFGLLGLDALYTRDFPITMGVLLIGTVLLMLGNILSDYLVALVDPRVRYK